MEIVGCGMTGLALALAMAEEGLKVGVLDQRALITDPEAHPDRRVTAVALGSARALAALTDWEAIAAHSAPIREIEVSEEAVGAPIQYEADAVGAEALGYIAPNHIIATGLARSVRNHPNIRINEPGKVAGYQADASGAVLELEDGRSIKTRLIAACDGKFSALRQLAGIAQREHNYKQTGIVCVVRHEKPHDGVAIERFFPSGPFAILPLPGNKCSIVWALEAGQAKAMLALDDDSFAAEVALRFGDRLGLVAIEGKRFQFPLRQVQSESVTSERLALVGDAARTIHPIAGQGWNIALRDALSLAELSGNHHRQGLDIGDESSLSAYANWRMMDNRLLSDITHGINALFSNDHTPLRWARQAGFGLVQQVPPLKSLFMRHAMADLGDLPTLMRG